MKAISMALAIIGLVSGLGHANEEITVGLPGGAKMVFVSVDPGVFLMGTTQEQEQFLRSRGEWGPSTEDEQPAHQVTINERFWLGKYELTQEQWEAVVGTQPWLGKENVQVNPNHPAVYISWEDVQSFIHTLNVATGDSIYRMPTEAEWEYACRAGTTTLWSFGDDVSQLGEYAWSWEAQNVDGRYGRMVGTKQPNPWGLYDMHGNVDEWCQDLFGNYPGGNSIESSATSFRVRRGGTFDGGFTRSASRDASQASFRYYAFGARILMIKSGSTSVTPHQWGEIKKGSR